MSTHPRTAIRRLSVRGYRSLRDVVLEDLPDIVVLHGPNGAGKSNLLRAVQLLLRAVAVGVQFPFGAERAISLPLKNADDALGLRPDDFHFGSLPEIRVEIGLDFGRRAVERTSELDAGERPVRIDLCGVFQLAGSTLVRFWFEQAHVNGGLEATSATAGTSAIAPMLEALRGTAPGSPAFLLGQQVRNALGRIVQWSEAYRVPGGTGDPQTALFEAFLSEDPRQREAAQRLGRRLSETRFFGARSEDVTLIPVESRTYGEKQIRFRHPTHGEISLRNLGSGEQQLVMLLAQSVITPFPIAQIEEPEAHLHTTLMEPLARILSQSVAPDRGAPDVDQLWIATHHHHFAIAPEFFDVSLDEAGATRVVLQGENRAEELRRAALRGAATGRGAVLGALPIEQDMASLRVLA